MGTVSWLVNNQDTEVLSLWSKIAARMNISLLCDGNGILFLGDFNIAYLAKLDWYYLSAINHI